MYTPLLAWLLQPIAKLPFQTALKAWFFLNALTLLTSVGLCAVAMRLTFRDAARVALMVIIAFRYWPTVTSFGYGQVNFALLAIVCGMILAEHRKNAFALGLLIALGAMVKPWMIGLILYPAVCRKWAALAWTIAASIILLATSFVLVGWQEWPRFLNVLAANSQQSGLVSQSILGFARLHFATNILVEPLTTDPTLRLSFMAVGVLMVFGALGHVGRLRTAESAYEQRLRFCFVVSSLLLLLPLCHSEYLMLLLPLLWTLIASKDMPSRFGAVQIVPAVLAYGLLTRPWPTCGPELRVHHEGWKSLVVSAQFFIGSGLWLFSFIQICRLGNAGRKETPEAAQEVLFSETAVAGNRI